MVQSGSISNLNRDILSRRYRGRNDRRSAGRKRSRLSRQLSLERMEERFLLAAEIGYEVDYQTPLAYGPYLKDDSADVAPPSENVYRSIVPGEVIVAVRSEGPIVDLVRHFDSIGLAAEASFLESDSAEEILMLEDDFGSVTVAQLQLSQGTDVQKAVASLQPYENIVWAAPNYQYSGDILDLTPNDPQFGNQYHHPLMQNDIAWDTTLGDPSVIVAVTDQGVELAHSDLAANIWVNSGEIAGNGIDDDGNGYIDDINGWDFVADDNDPNPLVPGDDHGTHVAGIAAGVTNNGVGISGTAGGASIMALRIQGSDGGFTSSIMADTFRYAIDNGATIANTSFNINGFVGDPTFTAGLQYYHDNGGLHFNSAGNSNQLNPVRQAFHQTILVASTTASDAKSGFSNYGTGIDVASPGSSIRSTVTNDGYGTKSGTSMAAPNAAGVAALVWSANPTWTRDMVAAAVLGTADNIDAQNPGFIGLLGSGRVNSANAIIADSLIPPPTVDSLVGLPADGTSVLVTDNVSGFTLRFDQLMEPASVNDVTKITLVEVGADGAFGGGDDVPVPITAATPYMVGTNEMVYTIDSGPLGVGRYAFTIDADVTNPFGDQFDGDANGIAGDAYQIVFNIITPAPVPVQPPGSLIYQQNVTDTIPNPGATDSYTVDLDAGQTVTVAIEPNSTLAPTIEVFDPGNVLLGSASSAAGVDALLQTLPVAIAGTYTVTVSGSGGTTGGYDLRTLLNAAAEEESYGGPANDTFATAQNLDASDVGLGFAAADRLAAVGKLPSSAGTAIESDDFESGALDAQWSTSSTGLGRIQISGAEGTAGGNFAMLMDVSASGSSELNEAIWTVDLAGVPDARLRFFHAEWGDETDNLPQSFVGSVNGDGVSISDDGINWYTVLDAPVTNSGVWTEALIDLDAAAAAAGMTLGSGFQIKFQQYDNFPLTTDGRGYDEIEILVPSSSNADWYEFTLNAGQSATLAVAQSDTSSGIVSVDLYAPDGTTRLATGRGSLFLDGGINNYVAPTTGTYYARVTGADVDYSFLVTRESDFDTEINHPSSAAQDITGINTSLGYVLPGAADYYQVSVNTGDALTIATATPSDGPFEFQNDFDPSLELYDPSGTLIGSDDNGGGDGRNARLTTGALSPAGIYTVAVLSTGNTEGEYVVDVAGATGTFGPFQVTDTLPQDGEILGASPAEITVEFNDGVLLTTIDAADLTANAVPATGVTVVDANTLRFQFTAVGHGVHTVSIAAGTLLDLQGTPIDAYTGQFEVDLVGPRVISSSIQQNDVLASGNLSVAIEFDEQLLAANLGPEDIALNGVVSGSYAPTSVNYVPATSTLTVDFGFLPQDEYTLTLISGDGAFEDIAGNDLDGEPLTFPLPPNVSGDGNPGGNFAVDFTTDITTILFPTVMLPRLPLGSLVYEGTIPGLINAAGDTDSYLIDLDVGQVVSVLVEPSAGLTAQVELLDPSNAVLATAASSAPGEATAIQTVDNTASGPGTYTLRVSELNGTVGSLSLTLFLNAAVEDENVTGTSNDTIGTAQDIDASSIPLAAGAIHRMAVLGDVDPSADDYFTFTLQAGEPATLAVKSDDAVSLDLVDASGNRLAIGVTAANLDEVISAFVPTADDTFAAVVSGNGRYNLVITRGSDFDTESNSEFGEAQLIQGGGTVLGHTGTPGAFLESVFEQGAERSDGDDGPGWSVGGKESTDRIIVEFADDLSDVEIAALATANNATIHARIKHVFNGAVLDVGANENARAMAQQWESLPEVIHAELNQAGEYFVTPNDPLFGSMWALNNTGQTGGTSDADIDAPEAWDLFNDSSNVVIAIVDSGVNYNHPDLNGSMWVNPLEIPGNFIDDDGNGFVDDIYGVNADTGTGDPMDGFGHGTHVAGTTAAIGNNNLGVTGVNWNAQIMALGIGTAGPSTAAAIIALDYLVDQKLNHGVNVVSSNHSYSVGPSVAFETAIQASIDAGVVFVAAAGNSSVNIDLSPTYPASYPLDGIIAVAATDHNDLAATFTNFGATSVDLGAPGVSILSTMLTSGGGISDPSGYGSISGTSMASPHVAGAAALLAAANPAASVTDIKAALLAGSDPIPAMAGITVSGGRLNLRGALEQIGSNTDDFYAVHVNSGDNLKIVTTTPTDGPFVPHNKLDPFIELFDPAGLVVASDDNSAADGHNATLNHTALDTGVYTVRVSNTDRQGEYTLQVTGDTGLDPIPTIIQTDPLDGDVVSSFPTTLTLTFSEQMLIPSVEPGDLLIGGVAASGVQVIDGQTFEFDVPAAANVGDGIYVVELVASSVSDLQGSVNVSETFSFELDSTPPIIQSTVWNAAPLPAGAIIPLGPLTFEASFSEPIQNPNLSSVRLVNTTSGSPVPTISVVLNATSDGVTAQFPPLGEGNYRLTLDSGDGDFEDLIGNDLDGEPLGPGVDFTPTGDSVAGGDYVIDFSVDITTPIPAVPFQRLHPLGGLLAISDPNLGSLFGPTDVDTFTFTAQAGEIIGGSVRQTSGSGSETTSIELVGIAGPFSANNPVLPVQVIPADGTYEIRVGGSGAFDYELTINSGFESELLAGDTSDGNEMAIDSSFISLGPGSGRYAVLGNSNATTGTGTPRTALFGLQTLTDQIVQIDPATGNIVNTYPSPTSLTQIAGISGAENGDTLIVQSNLNSGSVFRIDPRDGTLLTTEPMSVSSNNRGGLTFEDTSLYAIDNGFAVDRQDGFGGTVTPHLTTVFPDFPGALGGDDNGRHFVAANGLIQEFDPLIPNTIINTFPGPSGALITGLAFDGTNLFASDTANNLIYTLDPDTGAVLNSVVISSPIDGLGVANVGLSTGVVDVLLISDTNELTGVEPLLSPDGHNVTEIVDEWANASANLLDLPFLQTFDFVVWGASGAGTGDIHPQPVYDNLEAYIQSGGHLLVTGYDTLASPVDPGLAALVRSLTTNDTTSETSFTTQNIDHFVLNGPAGDLRNTQIVPGYTDWDGATADASAGTISLATFDSASAFDAIIYTDLPGAAGSVGYWTGGDSGSLASDGKTDWKIPGPSLDVFRNWVYGIPGDTFTSEDSIEDAAEASVIVNGSFEDGDFTGWTTATTGVPFQPWAVAGAGAGSGFGLLPTEPQDGSFVAWNGFDGGGPMEFTMYQDVVVPASAELSFQYRVQWDFLQGATANIGRTLDVELLDPGSGSLLATLLTFDTGTQAVNPTGNTGWRTETANLSSFAGQTVRLMFRETIPENFTGPAQIEFDAISLGSNTSVPDVDEYTLDLTGKTGDLIDIVLAGQDNANFRNSALQLIAPDGTTVLATGTNQPLATTSVTNYDVGIIDFVVPADGIYTIRLTSTVAGDYGLVVTDPLTFDTEPNDDPAVDPLRDLTTTRVAIGFAELGVERVEPDNFANGTVLDSLIPGVTLSDNANAFGVVRALTASFQPPTGTNAFGSSAHGVAGWSAGSAELRADFAKPVSTVSIDAGSDDSSDVSILEAYDAGSTLLASVVSVGLASGQSQTLSITRPTADIAFIVAYGVGGDISPLDNLRFTTVGTDSYQIDLLAGEKLILSTETLFDGSSATTANSLDPEIFVLNGAGAVLAQDQDSASDGRNAFLQFTAPGDGTYGIKVGSQDGTGEYLLNVADGATDDFGDAPSPYPTLFSQGGARHDVTAAVGPTLGPLRDAESIGQPTPNADGDDVNGSDDEDGVMFGVVGIGNALAGININLQNASEARVDAWLDFDGNGAWDAGDQILDNVRVFAGLQTLNFLIPAGAVAGDTYARVRVSSAGDLNPTGAASDGEVEDYLVSIVGRPTVQSVEINGDAAEPQRSNVTSVVVTFDSEVTAPASAFTIKKRDTDVIVDALVVNSSVIGGKTVSVLTFDYVDPNGLVLKRVNSEHSLVDGNYQLDIDGSQIAVVGGGPTMLGDYSFGDQPVDAFFRLFADHDGDRDVDTTDLGGFGLAFRSVQGDPNYDPIFNHDGDLDIDVLDLIQFGQRFRGSMPF